MTAPTELPDGLSRRRMLRNGLTLGAVTVAGVGALDALGSSATAADSNGGLVGIAPDGIGVDGESDSGPGVVGHSESWFGVDATSMSGVGLHAGSATGGAIAAETAATVAAVNVINYGSGPGTQANSATGIGGVFEGGTAAVRLVPRSATGHPTSGSHQVGELVVDHVGALWLCTKAGAPGTWKQLAFV
jgi:hypothetical protein